MSNPLLLSRSKRGFTIRPVQDEDVPSVDDVIIQAFGSSHGPDVNRLVRQIRGSGDYIPQMALVAELDGVIVGYIALSWVGFEGEGPDRLLQLTPLAVRPDLQRQGIGGELVRAVLALAEAAGEPLVLVQGIPAYYPRFGFERASTVGILPPWEEISDAAFMAARLGEASQLPTGRVVYPSSYDFLRADRRGSSTGDAPTEAEAEAEGRGLLSRINRYCHAVPLSGAEAEDVGPFTLFRSRVAWPYYARPRPGASGAFTKADVQLVVQRCAELQIPTAFEWVVECDPGMSAAADEAGLSVAEHPLLAMDRSMYSNDESSVSGIDPVSVLAGDPDEGVLAQAWAVAELAFGDPDMSGGDDGADARDRHLPNVSPDMVAMLVDRVRTGATVAAVVRHGDQGIIASGLLQPVGDMAEIVAVATLPAFRRRGFGAVVTAALLRHAFGNGVETVVLSAQTDAVARVYERVGFRRVGSIGKAEPTE